MIPRCHISGNYLLAIFRFYQSQKQYKYHDAILAACASCFPAGPRLAVATTASTSSIQEGDLPLEVICYSNYSLYRQFLAVRLKRAGPSRCQSRIPTLPPKSRAMVNAIIILPLTALAIKRQPEFTDKMSTYSTMAALGRSHRPAGCLFAEDDEVYAMGFESTQLERSFSLFKPQPPTVT